MNKINMSPDIDTFETFDDEMEISSDIQEGRNLWPDEVLGPSLFHLIGVEVELGFSEVEVRKNLTVSSKRYSYYQLTTPRGPTHTGIRVTPEDKVTFRTGGGRKLPPGEYIVSTFGREYFAMKTLPSES